MIRDKKINIPQEILEVYTKLKAGDYEAYFVGGCVRDLLLGRTPKDWDITTNAKPEEIQKIFPASAKASAGKPDSFTSFYENDFGTVGVKTGAEYSALAVVEVTPYRVEEKYSDKRHPDEVRFAKNLDDDLKRRDFTINAIALAINTKSEIRNSKQIPNSNAEIVDPFNGQKDLEKKIIRAVGDPEERFDEDALRIVRAIRFASELDFSIEDATRGALAKKAGLLEFISKERIRDEFSKLIMSDASDRGIEEMRELGMLKFILPELEEGWQIGQNKHHIYTVWEHSIRALLHAGENKWDLKIRIAALLHDVGKPRTKRGEGPDSTFYGHEVVGAKMAAEALSRLRYPKKMIEDIYKLVRWHLFFSDTEVVTLSAVRRIVRNVGEDNINDLLKVRYCDRIGMGRPKERPYRLRKYESMIAEALHSPLSVGQLTLRGNDVMKLCNIEAGPKIGFILHTLLEEVLDDPSLNTREYQEKRVKELCVLPEKELEKIGSEAKKKKDEAEQEEVKKIRKKYFVE